MIEGQEEIDKTVQDLIAKHTTVTLSTGVVLELRPPSPWAFMEAQRQIQQRKPDPPMNWNENKGREEPNEADPNYAVDLARWERDLTEQLYEVGVVTGTSIADPENLPIPGPESKELAGLLETLRIEISSSEKGRYLQWLKFMAAPTSRDITILYGPLLRMIGTSEEDVALATESFRGDEGRPANNGNRAERRSRQRHPVRTSITNPGADIRGT